ncbi:MAG: hypothetical protein RL095_1837 [Verrucomicrobiota bacterium]|jgi:serine/threonine protein kinase
MSENDPDSVTRRLSYEGRIVGMSELLLRAREEEVLASAGCRYSDAKRIASGGMKEIYQVFDSRTERLVAMARMHPDAAMDLKKQFLHEARITASLEHPSIMPVYDIGDEGGEPYFTMKLIRGRTLGELIELRQKTLPRGMPGPSLEELLGHFLKVCDAMACAHSHGVLHLDIKPENIQVGEFGEVLLCDWGLARRRGDAAEAEECLAGSLPRAAGLTLHGRVFGTPGFMGPEQASDSRLNLSPAADIYSLGAVLYNLLSGQRPCSGRGMTESMQMTVNGELASPGSLVSHPSLAVPAALEAVCMRAMALRPENRYASVSDLAAEIRSWMSGYATHAEDASPLRQLWLLARRHKIAVSVIVNALLVLAVASAVFVSNLKRKERESQANAETARQNARRAEANALVAQSREKEALETLRLLQKEQGEKARLGEEAASLIREKVTQSGDILGFKKAFDIASLVPDNPVLRSMQGAYWLSNQEFSKACDFFAGSVSEATRDLAAFAERHRGVAPGKLAEADFLELCRLLLKPDFAVYLVQLLEAEGRFKPQSHSAIFQKVMPLLNPHLQGRPFDTQALAEGRIAAALGLSAGDLRPLRIEALALMNFTTLDLSGCAVSDLTPLRRQSRLKILLLRGCPAKQLEPLSQLPLEELDLSNSAVTDLAPLRNPSLRRLMLRNCLPESLAPLHQLPQLEEISLSPLPQVLLRLRQQALPAKLKLKLQ